MNAAQKANEKIQNSDTLMTAYINSQTRISRFNSLALAQAFLSDTKYGSVTPIILGDDGKYWICSTPKWAYRLIAAGYQTA